MAIMVRKVNGTMLFQNMQEKGLITPRTLTETCFTLTSAMGLGGGQTPVLVIEL